MAEWITVFVIASLVIMSPGPNFFITLRNSLVHSRQAGVYTALGLAIADLIHMSYCLVGIGVIISQSILAFTLLKWIGAIYLVYVGVKSLRAKPQQASTSQPKAAMNNRSAFRMGLFTCLLNPKATLFYLALFTQIIQPNTPLWVQILYGATVAGIAYSAGYAFFLLFLIHQIQP
ncbi:LysE family transporter [Leptolyngbya sp. 7M]|uniref:LysE family transporter n=1 Tax=Leptolyngbya sp. 7M TaxID=2812896 RepID=UPI001B8D92CA|nr:LysE family transporter [Leptolyngbya sp. 7M]QYO62014.1 LysE family translocator [Leptolyngbya sp. 7M]